MILDNLTDILRGEKDKIRPIFFTIHKNKLQIDQGFKLKVKSYKYQKQVDEFLWNLGVGSKETKTRGSKRVIQSVT